MAGMGLEEKVIGQERALAPSPMTDRGGKRYQADELPSCDKFIKKRPQLLSFIRKRLLTDSQGAVLQRHSYGIQKLLTVADQGFLAFGRDLKVDGRYSPECVRIFGRKIFGVHIVKLLRQKRGKGQKELTELFQRAFSAGRSQSQEVLRQLPSIFRIGDKDVRIECKSLVQANDDTGPSRIVMILTDVTEVLKAAERISYLCYHDKLTSLFNRSYLETMLPELEKEEYLPLSVIMLDMNGLKLVNDVFGHEQGDRLLVAMGNTLVKSCRKTDILGRWGGDEFLVLLPRTDNDACTEVCDRIRRNCDQTANTPLPLSAAIGMVTRGSGDASLAEMFIVAENRMYGNKLSESPDVRRRIIASMESMLQENCFQNAGHIKRVRHLVERFADFLGYNPGEPEIRLLNQLAALHDVGKVAIPKEILGVAGPLTVSEWEIVKGHSEIGYRLAQSIGEPVLAELILALHERWDGKGYPFGLKGESVPLLVRLFVLVDVYDVITHDRPYKEAMDKQAALREIAAGGGSKFDPKLTQSFLQFMVREG